MFEGGSARPTPLETAPLRRPVANKSGAFRWYSSATAPLGPMTQRPLLKACRQVAADKPRRGRPPALELGFEAAHLILEQAKVSAFTTHAIPDLDNEEVPSISDLRTWKAQGAALGVTPWQARQSVTKALEAGPPFLPPGHNFAVSPLTRVGLLFLLRAGVFTPDDLCQQIGLSEASAQAFAEVCQDDSKLQSAVSAWLAARDRLIADLAKETRLCVISPYRMVMEARSKKKRRPLPVMPWLAVAGALRRVCATRQAYRAIGELSLTEGTKEQAQIRLVHRWTALREYVNAVTRPFIKGYGDLDLASILAEPSMVQLHGAMRYGSETDLRMLRMEVVFSRHGLLDTIIDSQLFGTPLQHSYPVRLDGKDGVSPEVEEAFSPLLCVPTGLAIEDGPVDGEQLLCSEDHGGLFWELRHRLLVAALWTGLGPWTW